MRLIRCLLYGFVDYSGFEMVIESKRSVRLLTDLELTNHSKAKSVSHNNNNGSLYSLNIITQNMQQQSWPLIGCIFQGMG